MYGPAVLYTLFGDPALRVKYSNDPSNNKNKNHQVKNHALFTSFDQRICFHQSGNVTIYSISGKIIANKNIRKQESITLPKGMYIFKFFNEALLQTYQRNVIVAH